jgi:hypothetical protein
MVMSATRSPSELPTAKMVSPRMASEMLKMTPKALRIPTTSSATVEIQEIATTNPTKQRRYCSRGGFSGSVKVRRTARETRPTSRA